VAGRSDVEAVDSALRLPPASRASARGNATILKTRRPAGGVAERSVQLFWAEEANLAAHSTNSRFQRLCASMYLTGAGASSVSRGGNRGLETSEMRARSN
jgi:hypothetical protein